VIALLAHADAKTMVIDEIVFEVGSAASFFVMPLAIWWSYIGSINAAVGTLIVGRRRRQNLPGRWSSKIRC
jgi:hypothetical protein